MSKKSTTTWLAPWELHPSSGLNDDNPVYRGRIRWDMPVPEDIASLSDDQMNDVFERAKKKKRKKPS
jgi:hypothetical protein